MLGHDRFAAVGVPVRAVKGYRRAAADFLRKVVFRAQLAMVAELLAWATWWRKTLSRTLLWVVTDGALAKRPL